MKLSELKSTLNGLNEISFELPNGTLVPEHFHVTEVGESTNRFIDCGGRARVETVVSLQLWDANNYNHRLHPEKLIQILDLCEKTLQIGNNEIEVEYQGPTTIEKYSLEFENNKFKLSPVHTDCLAKDACGIPEKQEEASCCAPGSGCC